MKYYQAWNLSFSHFKRYQNNSFTNQMESQGNGKSYPNRQDTTGPSSSYSSRALRELPTLVASSSSSIYGGHTQQSPAFDPTKMSTKERTRRLQAICKEGKSPMTIVKSGSGESASSGVRMKRGKKRFVQHIDTPHGKRFACATKGGINERMTSWMREGTRVMVKVRPFAPNRSQQEPNRLLQGAIVAFDKHWNLVMRDVDEVYMPPLRLGKVQTMPAAMPPSICYSRDKSQPGRPVLTRHLKCSFITGSSIVLIHNIEG